MGRLFLGGFWGGGEGGLGLFWVVFGVVVRAVLGLCWCGFEGCLIFFFCELIIISR